MSIERVAPEHIKVSDSETALKVTQSGSGNAFVVEDSESPDSSAFVIDNQGRVGIKKTPTKDLDVDGIISAANVVPGYATTATSSGSTTLTVASAQQQFFTGTQGHTVVLPVASTLSLGHYFTIHNNSTGALTINSSGGNLVKTLGPSTTGQFTCILTSGTTAASWDADTAEGSAYATTVTANGTTTLSVSSAQRQFFTGTQGQTVVLPAVNTLTLGQFYIIENNSAGSITVQSSGLNAVVTVPANRSVQLTAIATTGTDASVWDVEYGGASTPLATTAYVDTSISDLINEAPGALDTLNELAAALGDDANFATTVTNALAGKVNDTGDTITGEVVITTNTSGDALRVTQTGAGDALRVEDETNPDATPFIVKSDGAVGVGTATPTEKLSVIGDISATGSVISDELSSSLAQEVLSEATFYIDATDPGSDPNKVQNLGTGGSLLDATLGSTATADSNDPKYLEWDGTNYIYTPRVLGNNIISSFTAPMDITGDIDIRVKASLEVWGGGITQYLAGKWFASTSDRSWLIEINTAGSIVFRLSADGINQGVASSGVLGFSPNETKWIRTTWRQSDGRTQFFTSDDGVSWVQLGTDETISIASIHSSTVGISTDINGGTAGAPEGKIYKIVVKSGIDGTTVLDVDTSVINSGSDTSFTALTGQTVTINRSTSGRKTVAVTQPTYLFGTDDYMEVRRPAPEDDTYIRLPNSSGSYISIPDEAALDITGDIDIRAQIAPDTWTHSINRPIVSKWWAGASARSYVLTLEGSGKLGFNFTNTGSSGGSSFISTVAVPGIDSQALWIRATRLTDNGAGGSDVTFYTSTDGTSWTQLGSVVTVANTSTMYSGNAPVSIGAYSTGGFEYPANVYRAQILDGINGTTVLDVDARYAKTGDTSFNAATGQIVTVNNDVSIVESAYASALDFGANDSFTVLLASRYWGETTNSNPLSKQITGGTGYSLRFSSTPTTWYSLLTDVNNVSDNQGIIGVIEEASTFISSIDRSTDIQTVTVGSSTQQNNISALGSFQNPAPLRVGSRSDQVAYNPSMELLAVAIIPRALTAVEIAALNNYFLTRPAGGQVLTVKAPTLLVEGNVEVTGNGNRLIGPGAVYSVTSTTRPANPVEGDVIYETDTKLFFGWDGSLWKSIGGGAKGGGNDDVFYENAQTVTTNYTITTGKNAITGGPVSINSGVVIEIPSGSVWTVI